MIILDAGFSSKEYLTLLHELGYSYLINITRGSRQKYAKVARFYQLSQSGVPNENDFVVPFETNPCKLNAYSLMIRNLG